MLAFVQQILAFATVEVLEPNWRKLEVKLAKVQTVDQLLRDHVDFLDTCLKECMLTSSKLLRVSFKLLPVGRAMVYTYIGVFEDAGHLLDICAIFCAFYQVGQSRHHRSSSGRWRSLSSPYAKTVCAYFFPLPSCLHV
jgi:Gamma tubulin complex component C-terminal